MSQFDGVHVVAGAGGFIGGHLVRSLLEAGKPVVAADIKPLSEWHQKPDGNDCRVKDRCDLSILDSCRDACDGAAVVYNLAADMGGMGFIENNKALCMLSVLINTHLLKASLLAGVQRYFFASSACVYNSEAQSSPDIAGLRESDAYPAMPEDGYGWEKLFSERMCRHFSEDFGLSVRIARFHNVYGPHGTWAGGREKAPAAICRKVAEAIRDGRHEIEVWGDGRQTRSFMWIDDCIEGISRLMECESPDASEPVNLGTSEMVTIDRLVDLISEIAVTSIAKIHNLAAPLGVRGRNSDNTQIRQLLAWEPSTPLKIGLAHTYRWICEQVNQ